MRNLLGKAALLQASSDNSDDADWFVSGNGIGVDESFGGTIEDRAWYRVALVVDAVAGTLISYIDGAPVQTLTQIELDGRWSLDPTVLLLAR